MLYQAFENTEMCCCIRRLRTWRWVVVSECGDVLYQVSENTEMCCIRHLRTRRCIFVSDIQEQDWVQLRNCSLLQQDDVNVIEICCVMATQSITVFVSYDKLYLNTFLSQYPDSSTYLPSDLRKKSVSSLPVSTS